MFVFAGCGDGSPAAPEQATGLRGQRYCEVIAVQSDGGLRADVYNTGSFGNCPQDQWDALDPEAIQDDLGALFILMNGPRFWLIDSVTLFSETGERRFFGEIEMQLVASVEVPASGVSQEPYQERSVNRDTEFVFEAGSEVYELFAPGGEVYVMQSYAHIVDSTLDETRLPHLGGELGLPEGWTYQTRVVQEDYVVLDQDGVATVVQDELQNTYQFAGIGDGSS